MKVNYVLMYGTPYVRYKEFETFEDVSKFLVNKRIVNYSIFKKLEDKEEIEMIYRDNDINYLKKIIKEARDFVESMEYCGQEDYFYDLKTQDHCGNDNTFNDSKHKLLEILDKENK